MIKEELGEDKFRFYCNDIDWDDDFDDLILILKSKGTVEQKWTSEMI